MSRFWRTATKAGMAATALGLGLAVFSSQAAFAALGTVGTATPINPTTKAPLTGSQPSQTLFNFALSPTSGQPVAYCSGASSTNGTQEQSYLIPASTSPASLTYTGGNINGTGNFSLYDNSGAQVGPTNTATSGQVVAIQNANIDLGDNFPVSTVIPSGTSAQWNMGIACTVPPAGGGAATVTDYWNTIVTFTTSAGDPMGYTWTYGTAAVTPEAPLAVGLPIGGAAVIGTGAFINRRRRRDRRVTAAA